MTQDDCRLYETCSAPLCPLDRASLLNSIWYPDEEICRSRTFSNLTWIRQQGKIAKSASRTDRYFHPEMGGHKLFSVSVHALYCDTGGYETLR